MKIPAWVFVLVGLLLLGGGGYAAYTMTRGLRNNNPGNIRRSDTAWQGLAADQTDADFFQFASPVYGIRAMARILQNYVSSGYDTVREIINRWAPPSENDTASYVTAVSRALGVDPDATVNLQYDLPGLITAIIQHENGLQPYSSATILQGISLA